MVSDEAAAASGDHAQDQAARAMAPTRSGSDSDTTPTAVLPPGSAPRVATQPGKGPMPAAPPMGAKAPTPARRSSTAPNPLGDLRRGRRDSGPGSPGDPLEPNVSDACGRKCGPAGGPTPSFASSPDAPAPGVASKSHPHRRRPRAHRPATPGSRPPPGRRDSQPTERLVSPNPPLPPHSTDCNSSCPPISTRSVAAGKSGSGSSKPHPR